MVRDHCQLNKDPASRKKLERRENQISMCNLHKTRENSQNKKMQQKMEMYLTLQMMKTLAKLKTKILVRHLNLKMMILNQMKMKKLHQILILMMKMMTMNM